MNAPPSALGPAADQTQPDHLLGVGRYALSSQPFSVLLGARLAGLRPGRAEIRLVVTRFLQQQHGVVHGGVVAYLADTALTFAGGALLGGGVVTAELKINHLQPADGRELVARASVIHAGRSLAGRSLALGRCDIMVVDEAGREVLCAAAQGSVSRLRPEVDVSVPE